MPTCSSNVAQSSSLCVESHSVPPRVCERLDLKRVSRAASSLTSVLQASRINTLDTVLCGVALSVGPMLE